MRDEAVNAGPDVDVLLGSLGEDPPSHQQVLVKVVTRRRTAVRALVAKAGEHMAERDLGLSRARSVAEGAHVTDEPAQVLNRGQRRPWVDAQHSSESVASTQQIALHEPRLR